MPAKHRARWLAGVCAGLLTVGGCTANEPEQPSADSPARDVVVTGIPDDLTVEISDAGNAAPPSMDLAALSSVYSIGPSGALEQPAHITIALDEAVGSDTAVVAAVREDQSQPWEYLPATLNADGTRASFETPHFSFFSILGFNVASTFETFKTDFIDALSAGATSNTVATPPTCDEEDAARTDGYHITSSSGDAIYWCFGIDDAGRRVLKVANNRRYPLQAQHPNMQTLANPRDYLALSSLSRFASGGYAIIAPGDTATFNADLGPGGIEGIRTEMDGFGQALYQLQVGVESLGSVLTRFGASEYRDMSARLRAFETLLQSRSCADALGEGPGAILAGCFSPAQLVTAFGGWSILLAPLVAFGPLVIFFRSEWNALFDQFNGRDQYRIDVVRDAPAVPPAGTGTAGSGGGGTPMDTTTFIADWVGTTDVPGVGRIGMQVGKYADRRAPLDPLTGDISWAREGDSWDRFCGGQWDEVSRDATQVIALLVWDDQATCGRPTETITLRLDATDQLHVSGQEWTAVLDRTPD
jgi:hypothetical protein